MCRPRMPWSSWSFRCAPKPPQERTCVSAHRVGMRQASPSRAGPINPLPWLGYALPTSCVQGKQRVSWGSQRVSPDKRGDVERILRSVEQEMQTLDLGDERRDRRAKILLSSLLMAPEASIPTACGSQAASKAAYRFLSSDIDPRALSAAHYDATVERVKGRKRVLALDDITGLDFTGRPGIKGLGPLDSVLCRGLKVQTVLVVSEAGEPLGVVDQRVWARKAEEVGKRHTRRKRAPREKESWGWREGFEAAQERLPAETEVIGIGDREADIYFVLAMPRRENFQLLIRATHNRKLQDPEYGYLREAVEAAPVLGTYDLKVERTRKRRARTAKVQIRARRVVLNPPRHGVKGEKLGPMEVSVILARECGEVPKGEPRIEWLLLATWPVETLEQALECVRFYAHRWKLERYHFVLKSGCRIENLQLEHVDRLKRALALYSIVAWRLLYLTYRARLEPSVSCAEVLEEDVWRVLMAMTGGAPGQRDPPGLREAVHRIARLGGFQGRKGDGEPGVKALWQGWRRLMDFVLASRTLSHA